MINRQIKVKCCKYKIEPQQIGNKEGDKNQYGIMNKNKPSWHRILTENYSGIFEEDLNQFFVFSNHDFGRICDFKETIKVKVTY